MTDAYQKFRQYFLPQPDYWVPSNCGSDELRLGCYPLSFKQRLAQGHYQHFDEQGLPLFHSKAGILMHFCTGLTSFALAHWELYVETGTNKHAEFLLKAADYLISTGESRDNGALMILDYDNDQGENGVTCAMNQGKVISVACRAYNFTKDSRYIDSALKMAVAFEYPYGSEGVTSNEMENHLWFLEAGLPILNGHIYALFGLKELATITEEKWITKLFIEGSESVINTIHLFDSGKWSLYWYKSPSYIASAMYHNLHICQLEILSEYYPSEVLKKYAEKFRGYCLNPINRYSAGFQLVRDKINLILS